LTDIAANPQDTIGKSDFLYKLFVAGEAMMLTSRRSCAFLLLALSGTFVITANASAEALPLKQAVDLALAHSTTMAASHADQQRAFASYVEARDQYLPQLVVGSGLGKSWGYPLSLEGSAPSIVNTTAQSAVYNPALREFVRAAHVQYQESKIQSQDQRDQVIQDTVLSYTELCKWQKVIANASHEYDEALKMEQLVNQRIQEGIDSSLARNQARLVTARVYLRMTQAQGSVDVLRNRLSQLTGLPADSIEADAGSIPALPEVKQEDDLVKTAQEVNPSIRVASMNATAMAFNAKGEHRAMWPSFDFAAQYALLATFNNYQNYFQKGSFQQENATVGVLIRFPFFSPSQHAKSQAADAVALRARNDVEVARNQVSEQTLKLQRAVDQLAAAQQVADLEYQIAKSNLDAAQVRIESGSATFHDAEDARVQSNERFGALQDADFELDRARIALLRVTGKLDHWVGVAN
jgi:outer membrane protein TolC